MNDNTIHYASRVLRALADSTRQKILSLLRRNGEMRVGDIALRLQLTQPTVSQHLRILKESGALIAHKRGQQVYYRLCSEKVYDALKAFLAIFDEETASKRSGYDLKENF